MMQSQHSTLNKQLFAHTGKTLDTQLSPSHAQTMDDNGISFLSLCDIQICAKPATASSRRLLRTD